MMGRWWQFLLWLFAVLFLTACNEPEIAPTESVRQPTVSTVAEPTNPTLNVASEAGKADVSATLQTWVMINQAVVIAEIDYAYPKLTQTQRECLDSPQGHANYISVVKPFLDNILSGEEMAQSDEFYASQAGQKLALEIKRELGAGADVPDITPTPTEQQQIIDAIQQPFFLKVQQATDGMSEEMAFDFLMQMMQLELERCQITQL